MISGNDYDPEKHRHYCWKTPHQCRVEAFMRAGGQEVPGRPTMPDFETRRLRAQLILEEAMETIEALGFCVEGERGYDVVLSEHIEKLDLEKIADGCADLSVVTTGTLSACGISDDELLMEVDANNAHKVRDGVIKDANGKIQKPADWRPPQIQRVLDDQTRRAERDEEYRNREAVRSQEGPVS